jgi:hypothetical protein
MSNYEYDVFLSYRRGQRALPGGEWPLDRDGEWVHRVFFPEFKHWLDQEYPGARIAFDRDLPLGQPWESTLRHWLRHSKCLVAVWNPLYFRSQFCRSEFHSMLERQRKHMPAGAEGPGLVLPAVYADGQWFDEEARSLQYSKSFSPFSRYSQPIRQDEFAHAAFATAMQDFCGSVASAIKSAPAFDPSFSWIETAPLPPAHAFGVPRLQ